MAKNIAIIGAGASGLLASIVCARAGIQVSLFEQNTKVAKKILVSGNGRCNITNKNLSYLDYYGANPHFVSFALERFGFEQSKKFFASLGLLFDTKEDGRVYPLSNEAKSVVHLLQSHATNLGVVIHYNAKINSIKDFLHKYDAVVVATGSRAASHLGGNSDGELFAQEFGHTTLPAYPSLVQLEIDAKVIHRMAGAKVQGEVTLFINHAKEESTKGDILFTNYGISGFAILDISQKASLALQEYNHVSVSLNLLPSFTMQQLSKHISTLAQADRSMHITEILIGLIPSKIVKNLLESLEITDNKFAYLLHQKEIKKIANTLLNWRFEVEQTHGFRHAEVSGGGINTAEIDPKTFASLKQKNLYFCGEVLDIVGKRGGYNFAFAWASGYLAAQDIIHSS